jgi:hypothetical protein
MTREEIQSRIRDIIIKWTPDLHTLENQKEIIAIYFGFQKVWDGFEFCLSGHSWYDDHNSQLIGDEWNPRENYISLGSDSLQFDRLEIMDIYEKIVGDEMKNRNRLFHKLERVLVGPNDGDPKKLK